MDSEKRNAKKDADVNPGSEKLDSLKGSFKSLKGKVGDIAGGIAEKGKAFASSEKVQMVTEAVGDVASTAADVAAQKASEAATEVKAAVDKGAKIVKENSFATKLKESRISGFMDGINQGAYLAGQKRYNFYYAYVATLCYFLQRDDDYSTEDEAWLSDSLSHLRLDGGIPEEVKAKLYEIAQKPDLTFDDAKGYLDQVSLVSLDSIVDDVVYAINPKCLDLGGAAVLVYRLFTDLRFMAKVKEDYLNAGLNDIYEERAKGVLY